MSYPRIYNAAVDMVDRNVTLVAGLAEMFRLIPTRGLWSKPWASQSGHCPALSAITMRIRSG